MRLSSISSDPILVQAIKSLANYGTASFEGKHSSEYMEKLGKALDRYGYPHNYNGDIDLSQVAKNVLELIQKRH